MELEELNNLLPPALQQTVCTTPFEALEQMLSKVQKAKPSPFRLIAYEKWESKVRNLRGAIQLIKDSQLCEGKGLEALNFKLSTND